MHCYTRFTQIKNRCIMGGKGRGVFSDFRLGRVSRSQILPHINQTDTETVPIPNKRARREVAGREEGELVKEGDYGISCIICISCGIAPHWAAFVEGMECDQTQQLACVMWRFKWDEVLLPGVCSHSPHEQTRLPTAQTRVKAFPSTYILPHSTSLSPTAVNVSQPPRNNYSDCPRYLSSASEMFRRQEDTIDPDPVYEADLKALG